jgi:hypothetical protein
MYKIWLKILDMLSRLIIGNEQPMAGVGLMFLDVAVRSGVKLRSPIML